MSLLAELRRRTRDAHDRLEERLDVPARCRTEGAYAALLLALRTVHAPLEAAIAASPAADGALPDWRSRRKTGWLDEDLAALGVDPSMEAADVAPLGGDAEVLGTAYVLEGATLGGALIVRQLRASFADPPPHRFFTSYSARRGAQWRAFRAHAEAAHADGVDTQRVVDAARATFARFERCTEPTVVR